MNDNLVITIGRQMGSGGRQVGQALARRLGFAYYDKELLAEAARRAGVAPEFFERNDERMPSFLQSFIPFTMGMTSHSFYAGSTCISSDALQRAQCDLIASLPSQGPCVVVGRSADFVLRDHPLLVSVFISASMEARVDRIVSREPSLSRERARVLAERADKLRANYYNFYTDHTWGAAATYDLCVDSTHLGPEAVVEIVISYIRQRFPGVLQPQV